MDDGLQTLLLALGVTFSALAVITTIGNGGLLFALWWNRSKLLRAPTAHFLAGISIANFLTGAITNPLEAYHCFVLLSGNGSETFENNMRKAHMVSILSMNTSLLMCVGLCVSQLIAVRFPYRYSSWVTRGNVWLSMLLFVVITTVFALMRVMGLPLKANNFTETFVMLGFIPLCLVVLNVYLCVAYQRQQSCLQASAQSAEKKITESQGNGRSFNKRLAIATIVMVGSVTIFTLPESVISYIDIFWENRTKEENKKIIICEALVDVFFLLKFALDPFICAWRLSSYRKVFVKPSPKNSCSSRSRGNAQTTV